MNKPNNTTWAHNIQYLLLPFPPEGDDIHHCRLADFRKKLNILLEEMYLPREPLFTGFYRANEDWDNIDPDPDQQVLNLPNRASYGEGFSNEP